MPDIVTAVPDVLTCWRKLPLSRSLSFFSLCDSLADILPSWAPEGESERERDTAGYRKRRKYWHIREIDTAWLVTYPSPAPLHPSSPIPFQQLMSTSGAAPFASAFGATLCRFVSSNVWTGPQGRDVISAAAAARQKFKYKSKAKGRLLLFPLNTLTFSLTFYLNWIN